MTAAVEEKKVNTKFLYTVRRTDGRLETGSATHQSREAVIARLAKDPKYQSVLSVQGAGKDGVGKARPKQKDLVAFSRMFEAYLTVGEKERDAIEKILSKGGIDDVALKYGLQQVSRDMGQGVNLDEAMSRHPYIFPRLMVSTYRTGRLQGTLAQAAVQAADDLEQEDDMRSKIKKAMTYPMVVLATSSLIFVFLMVWVVPKFTSMYDSLSGGTADLPFLTQMVSAVSDQMTWLVPVLAVVGLVVGLWYRKNSQDDAVRAVVDPIKLKLPIFGNLFRKIAYTRFCRVFASLSDNGIHPTDALAITAASVGNLELEKSIMNAREGKLRGEPIAERLESDKLFPPLLTSFLTVGENSGKMGHSLSSVGRLYARDVDGIVNNMQALIEPFFLVVIAAMVGVVAIAIYLPYFSIGDLVSPY